MSRFPLIVAILVILATQATALSCMRPDPVRSYNTAADAEELYLVALGKVSFDASKLPKAEGNTSPERTRIPARIEGKALSKTGFDYPFERDITVEVLCFGPWCGGGVPGETYLAFLRKTEEGYVMTADPCWSMAFSQPSQEDISRVVQCHKTGRCMPHQP
jgi:hypothetical protein